MGKIVCFTGHRPQQLNGFDPMDNLPLLRKLNSVIKDHIDNGYTTFISGMALGIDMWAARIVINLKKENPDIKLVAAIPCVKQFSKWNRENVEEWCEIVERADTVHYVSEEPYTPWCMQKRNEWMVDNSNSVIAVWNGAKGGTGNCVKYAEKLGKEIVRIHPKTLEITE